MSLYYLMSGTHACLVTRHAVLLPKNGTLTVRSDAEEGSTCCLFHEKEGGFSFPVGEGGKITIPETCIPEGQIRVVFQQNGKTVDGGALTVTELDADGTKRLMPALMASAVEKERHAQMMADLLIRLKCAEDMLDELKNGADIIA